MILFKKFLLGAWRADSGANGGTAVLRGAVLSFGAKESTKESTRHGDSGKKALIAHFAGGARNVARNLVGQLIPSPVRAPVLTFFRRQNGRAFFPPLPIAALLRRSWLWAGSDSGAWDAPMQLVLQRRKTDSIFSL